MTKHTPAPWTLGNVGEIDQPILANGMDIGNVYAAECGPVQAKANACLIVATPELLKALSELCEAYRISSPGATEHYVYKQAKQAIKQALGED